MSLFCCPLCAAPLEKTDRTYRCPRGHSFDRAREGYVHLLPANRMHSKAPGDDKAMAAARNRFLSGGWYAPLRDALCRLAVDHAPARVDLLLNCFSPLALEEFRRVLRPGGVFLYVVPAARHLWELKQVLYERPYPNPEEDIPYEGFDYLEVLPVEETLAIRSREPLLDLFQMTPYRWKTPRTGVERLEELEALDVTASFRIHVFRRK